MKLISDDQVVYALSAANAPVLTVAPGEEVVFRTKDCFSDQIKSERDLFSSVGWATINPATGPLAVTGAEPGDTLVVDIIDIKVADQGCMVCVPEMGALGHLIRESETMIIPIRDGKAVFSDRLWLPLRPMIGVIGTAPADGAIATGEPGRHGGNMDTRQVCAGSRLYLPVFACGGLLAMGDLHAVMGDGEVSLCGLEIPGEVTVRVGLVKSRQCGWPVLETGADWYVIASGDGLDEAARLALDATVEFLGGRLDMTTNEIISLLSLAGNLEISQIVDPLKTVRMRLPKSVFGGLTF